MECATSVRRVRDSADPALSTMAAIYAEAIPAAERKPATWLAAAAGRADFAVLVAEAAGRVVGFATIFLPGSPSDSALLEYLAVAADARGGGVGATLFRTAVDAVGRRPLLVEVESVGPTDPGRHDSDQRDRVRRQAFYRRLGCRQLTGLRYRLPWPGDVPAMDLMGIGTGPAISRPAVAGWVRTIYRDVYGCDDAARRAAAVVAGASDPIRAE